MNLPDYNAFCATLPASFHVVQWGESDVWKVGDAGGNKVFAIAHERPGAGFQVTFKVTPDSYDILKEQPGLRPAPYLASRGMKWIQHFEAPGLSDDDLKLYLAHSHKLAAANLTKKQQRAFGFA